jgi:hypothetical protein
VWLALDAHQNPHPHPQVVDMQALYAALRLQFAGLNIEGAFVDGPDLCLPQRGSRRWPGNACVRLALAAFADWLDAGAPASMRLPSVTSIQRFDLGALGGVPLAFTDADDRDMPALLLGTTLPWSA